MTSTDFVIACALAILAIVVVAVTIAVQPGQLGAYVGGLVACALILSSFLPIRRVVQR
jgi:hypothetical protein